MEGVDLFFENLEGSKKELALSLHQFILSYQGISPKIRYNIPKKGGVELAFIRANKLQESKVYLILKIERWLVALPIPIKVKLISRR